MAPETQLPVAERRRPTVITWDPPGIEVQRPPRAGGGAGLAPNNIGTIEFLPHTDTFRAPTGTSVRLVYEAEIFSAELWSGVQWPEVEGLAAEGSPIVECDGLDMATHRRTCRFWRFFSAAEPGVYEVPPATIRYFNSQLGTHMVASSSAAKVEIVTAETGAALEP